MGIIKSKSQMGENVFFECCCGMHLIRIVKDEQSVNSRFPVQHSLQFWEFRGDTSWTLFDRIKLAFRILIGKEAKYATYDVVLNKEDVEPLANAIRNLNS